MSFHINDKEKYKELLEVSNPKIVLKNAKKYLGNDVELYVSSSKQYKYNILDDRDRKINFGSIKYQDFTKHNDPIKRENYLKRSAGIKGDWKDNKYSKNNLSRILLWNAEF